MITYTLVSQLTFGQKRVSDFANLAYDELLDVWQNLQIEWPNYLIHYINY